MSDPLLRNLRDPGSGTDATLLRVCWQAADEIERLRARIAELEKYKLDCNAYAATVRALERAVEEICHERATPPLTRARLRHALAGVDWRKAR